MGYVWGNLGFWIHFNLLPMGVATQQLNHALLAMIPCVPPRHKTNKWYITVIDEMVAGKPFPLVCQTPVEFFPWFPPNVNMQASYRLKLFEFMIFWKLEDQVSQHFLDREFLGFRKEWISACPTRWPVVWPTVRWWSYWMPVNAKIHLFSV